MISLEATGAAGFGRPGSVPRASFWLLPIQMRKEAIALLREMGAGDRAIARHLGLNRNSMQSLLDTQTRPFRGAEDLPEEE